MKIAFVLDDRLDKPDGVQQYVTLLGSWLASQGHDVHYIVGHSPKATQKNIHHLSKTVAVRFNKNRMAIPLPASKKVVKHLLQKEAFDLLHVQMPYSPLLAGIVVASAGPATAVVGTFHILPHGSLSRIGTKALSAILHTNKKRFDSFISVSSSAALFAHSHFGITSSVLPNVVNLSTYQMGKPLQRFSDKANIIFLGRFVERKGAHLALRAYKKMLHDHPELALTTRLLLCGNGPDRQKLEAAARDIKISGADIVFTGFLSEDEKKDYLASAAIAVFPSTGGESFGIVLIEAMAAGAGVVLGGDNNGYKTVLGKQPSSLIHPDDTDSFAKSLHYYLTHKEDARHMHMLQQKVVATYDIKKVGPEVVAFYEHALAKRHVKKDT